MNLVDILARELKEWPEGVRCLTQSAVDKEIYDAVNGEKSDDVHHLSPPFNASERHTEDSGYPCVNRAEWQDAVSALGIPKFPSDNPEWTGEGLPPVGTVCEWHPNQDGWVQVEILGHNGEETWFRREGHTQSEVCLRMAFFRPIRTPEQIAAEERERAINAMVELSPLLDKKWTKPVCAALYDAGYRKFEFVDG